MRRWPVRCWPVVVVVFVCLFRAGSGLAAAPKVLLDAMTPRVEQRLKPSWGCEQQVSVGRSQNPAGVILNVQPGQAGYPGAELKPEGAASWDLSAYDHVEMRVVNTGSRAATFALRVDNNAPGQRDPWNTEQISLQPGQAGTVSVVFGQSYGHKPGYALKPDAVTGLVMFTMQSDAPQSFRIERLVAAGPGAGPSYVAAVQGDKPQAGSTPAGAVPGGRVLLGASAAGTSGGVRVVLPEGNSNQAAAIRSSTGRWDLHDATEIRVVVRNEGTTAITPRVQATSDGNGATDAIRAGRALGPGEECEIVVPLAASALQGSTPFRSDVVTSVRIMAERTGSARMLIKSVVARSADSGAPGSQSSHP